jgi:hypothetical protein
VRPEALGKMKNYIHLISDIGIIGFSTPRAIASYTKGHEFCGQGLGDSYVTESDAGHNPFSDADNSKWRVTVAQSV